MFPRLIAVSTESTASGNVAVAVCPLITVIVVEGVNAGFVIVVVSHGSMTVTTNSW